MFYISLDVSTTRVKKKHSGKLKTEQSRQYLNFKIKVE